VATHRGLAIPTARVHDRAGLSRALHDAGLVDVAPTVVLVGGAGGMSQSDLDRTEQVIERGIIPAVVGTAAAIVDGGTDSGVMRLAGGARSVRGASFALVGVVGADTVEGQGSEPERGAPLEPNHTMFVVVPGKTWGDEAPWLFRVAQMISGSRPVVTVLLNGGAIAWKEIEESVRRGQRVVAVGGTGRAADELALASGGADHNRRATDAFDTGLVEVVDASEPERLQRVLTSALSGVT
jgi:hypothetical protein